LKPHFVPVQQPKCSLKFYVRQLHKDSKYNDEQSYKYGKNSTVVHSASKQIFKS
jgi:hypothetical protein